MHRDWQRRTRKWKRHADYESYRLRELSCRHERRKRGCVDDNDRWSMRARLVPRNSQQLRDPIEIISENSATKRGYKIIICDIPLHFFFFFFSFEIRERGGPLAWTEWQEQNYPLDRKASRLRSRKRSLGLQTAVLCQSKRTLEERIT